MDPTRFDNLARSLAQPASRRGALGVVVGGALALLETSSGTAKRRHRHSKGRQAATGGNRDCAHFCQIVFPPGPARGQCVSDAAHNQGLCRQCAAAASAVCCTQTADGTCDPTQPVACCATDETCQHGACVACTPDCTGKCSGESDGCGGTCRCPAGASCGAGFCVRSCKTDADCPSSCSGGCAFTRVGGDFLPTTCAGAFTGVFCNPFDVGSCSTPGQFCAAGNCRPVCA